MYTDSQKIRISILVIGFLSGLSLLAQVDRSKQSSKQFPYFQRAIEAFQKGKYERAYLFSERAKRDNPKLKEKPESLRLEAILLLTRSIQQKKIQTAFLKSFAKENTSAFAYFLGNYFLNQRNFLKSGFYFNKAVELYRDRYTIEQSYPKKAANDFEYSLAPFHCPGNTKIFSDSFRKNWREELHRKARDRWLWTFLPGSIRSEQARLAAWQAYIFLPHQRKYLSDFFLSLPKKNLLLPNHPESYEVCLSRLGQVKKDLELLIKKGSIYHAKKQLAFIKLSIRQIYRNRMRLFHTLQSSYAYGIYLQETGKYLEALHIFRHSLKISGTDLPSLSQKGKEQIMRLQEIIFGLRGVYQNLKRNSDAQALRRISNYLIGYRKGQIPKQRWIRLTYNNCKKSMFNRECILFLLSDSNYSDAKRLKFYRSKLFENHTRWENQELRAAFSYLELYP